MAPSRPRTQSSHGRLHKRGSSASSITSPSALSPLSDAQAFAFNRSDTPRITYEEPWTEAARPMPSSTSAKPPLKIKPYLRKLSSKDGNSLDLSRPAAENEGLAGLGISQEYGGYSRAAADVNFTGMNSRGRHNRSTSNNSQFSTTSSLTRPTATHLPPIRQTPQPYTPPISKSTPPSVLESEHEADNIMTDEEFRLRQAAYDPAKRSGSLSSAPGVAPALRIHTTGSSTRLAGSYSQSSISLTSPVAPSRSRGDTLRSMDTATSPSSRTSFDKAFGFIRGGRDSPVDAASRAASIRAARQAFNEKEEAKERKYEQEAYRQAEREHKKQHKREQHQRRKSEGQDASRKESRSRSVSDLNNEKVTSRPSLGARPSMGGRQYSDHRQAHSRALPTIVQTVSAEKPGAQPHVTKSRRTKSRWLRFVTWFKTRVLRMSRKMHKSSSRV